MSADPITAYLAELRGLLRGSPRDNGRLLLELEAHLRDAQATAVAQGLVALDAAEVQRWLATGQSHAESMWACPIAET